MPFLPHIVRRAWNRQGGRCAYCCKELTPRNRDKGERGAWHAHHRKPEDHNGSNTLQNCVIFCINEPENCHLNIGHDGNYRNYCPLNDSELPCLYVGKKRTRKR